MTRKSRECSTAWLPLSLLRFYVNGREKVTKIPVALCSHNSKRVGWQNSSPMSEWCLLHHSFTPRCFASYSQPMKSSVVENLEILSQHLLGQWLYLLRFTKVLGYRVGEWMNWLLSIPISKPFLPLPPSHLYLLCLFVSWFTWGWGEGQEERVFPSHSILPKWIWDLKWAQIN